MEVIGNVIDVLKGAWPTIQPNISTVFTIVITKLFLRGNSSITEIEKIKQSKFSEVAEQLLKDGHITHLEYYKCRNFNKIAEKADKIYRQNQAALPTKQTEIDNHEFTVDWFIRFFGDAGNISDEQMQELWAKVLAGEIKQPGSFSLRTLTVLRNLSQSEAEILQTILSYALPMVDCYISIDEYMLCKYNYKASLKTMYDCGIIENTAASRFNLTMNGTRAFMSTSSLVCIAHTQIEEEYTLDMQRFTKTGNELIRLVTPNDQYLLDFFKQMKSKNPNLNLTAHSVIQTDGLNGNYLDFDLLLS